MLKYLNFTIKNHLLGNKKTIKIRATGSTRNRQTKKRTRSTQKQVTTQTKSPICTAAKSTPTAKNAETSRSN